MFLIQIFCAAAVAGGRCSGVSLAVAQKKTAVFLRKDFKDKDPWKKFRDAFKGHRECMVMTETYDFGEAVRKMMLTQWETIGGLEKYKKEDAEYYDFVMSALTDETADQDDFKKINKLSENCPSGTSFVCSEISKLTQPTN